jgi:hypothetical protein
MKTVGNGQKRTYDIEKRKRSVQDISTFSNQRVQKMVENGCETN